MQLKNNYFIHSLAGSGKTTRLVKYALRFKNKKIIITTYTNKNLQEIISKINEINGCIPSNIQVITWFSFLLEELCRPYQRCLGIQERISNIRFMQGISVRYVPESKTQKHYFDGNGAIYSDKIGKFAYKCIEKTNDVINRLEKICDYLFIDEAQDLAGFDFEILNKLLDSKCRLIMVGDMRQNTFNTSPTSKNKSFAKNIHEWFKEKENLNKGKLKYLNICWRCNPQLCKFSDKVYPELGAAIPKNNIITGHDGLFYVKSSNLYEYIKLYSPLILINDVRAKNKVPNLPTMNYGLSKGLTVDRVLVVPTNDIKNYLKTGKLPTTKHKFYIAVTRARYSVAFLIDNKEDTTKFYFSDIKEYC